MVFLMRLIVNINMMTYILRKNQITTTIGVSHTKCEFLGPNGQLGRDIVTNLVEFTCLDGHGNRRAYKVQKGLSRV